MKRRVVGVLLLLLVTGCRLLVPKTCALEDVHEAYKREFAVYVQPESPAAKPPMSASSKEVFPETLRLARAFTVQYGEESAEAAHLRVLEGMIYLQSGRLALAKAAKAGVAEAEARLMSGAGVYTRDALFAACYGHLVDGALEQQIATSTTPDLAKGKTFETAADGIAEVLNKAAREKKLADPDVDQGAVHLATTAAIYYLWAGNLSPSGDLAPYKKKGFELIGRHLSESEKAASAGAKDASSPGRLRYLAWYDFLGK